MFLSVNIVTKDWGKMETVRVGGAVGNKGEVSTFVRTYLENANGKWAYPAYDGYPGGPTSLVSEQDFFGAVLLNVPHVSLPTYYALCASMDAVNEILGSIQPEASLLDAAPRDVELVAQLFGLLDTLDFPGVRLTIFSKILHRKRPGIVPLYDEHIRRCYQELGDVPPVPTVKGRTWADFTRAWLPVVAEDLRSQESLWNELSLAAPGPRITPLRALDMAGWHLGGMSEGELADLG